MEIWFSAFNKISLISVLHVNNSAYFLNATCVLLFAFTVTSSVTKINASA